MSQDLKKMFEAERRRSKQMPEGHEARFEAMLGDAFREPRRKRYYWIGIAATLLLMISLGVWTKWQPAISDPAEIPVAAQDSLTPVRGFSLGDVSPDLRKLEQYYTANINLQLARLDISDRNREVADGYMNRLRELDTEYMELNRELNEIGPNEETITAMIRNFQFRLQLLLKLKEKLNEIKQSNNESIQNQSI